MHETATSMDYRALITGVLLWKLLMSLFRDVGFLLFRLHTNRILSGVTNIQSVHISFLFRPICYANSSGARGSCDFFQIFV